MPIRETTRLVDACRHAATAFLLWCALGAAAAAQGDAADLRAALETLGYGGASASDGFDFGLAVRQYQAAQFVPVTGQLTEVQEADLLTSAAARRAEAARIAAAVDPATVPQGAEPETILGRVNEWVRAEAARINSAGLVYRSPLYWEDFARRIDISALFDGRFEGLDRESYNFAMLFNAYVVAYSRRCEDHLPVGSAVYQFSQRRQTFDGWGFKTGDYTVPVDRIVVHPDMQVHYDRFSNHPASRGQWEGQFLDFLNLRGRAMGPADQNSLMQRFTHLMIEPEQDFTRFLASEGCASAPSAQMQANLLRHAGGRTSLQADGARFADLPPSVAFDGGVLTERDMGLADRLYTSLISGGGADDMPIQADAIGARLVWEDLGIPAFLDASTRDVVIRSGGRDVGWTEILHLYNIANSDMPERGRFQPVFFTDDSDGIHTAHVRVGWTGEGIYPTLTRLTFTVRPLPCEAYRAGLIDTEAGVEGDTGFGLLAQRNYGMRGLTWGKICNPIYWPRFDEALARAVERAAR